MATRTRLNLPIAILTSDGVIRELGSSLSYHDRPASLDSSRREIALAMVRDREYPVLLEELRKIDVRGILRTNGGELHLGQDAEHLVRRAERARSEAYRRTGGHDGCGHLNDMVLYANAERYRWEGLF